MELLIFISFFAFITWIVWKWKFLSVTAVSKKLVVLVFILKVLAGVGLVLIYEKYYTDRSTADIFKYFDDSKLMHEVLFESPKDYIKMLSGIGDDRPYFKEKYYDHFEWWYRPYESSVYNDSHVIIRVNAFFRLFSFQNIYVHSIFFSFLSFIGLILLVKFFVSFFKGKERLLFFAFMLMPSVVLWSSAPLKEALLFFVLGFFFFSIQLFTRKWLISLILLLITSYCLILLKFYVFMVLIPCLIPFLLQAKLKLKFPIALYLASVAIFSVLAINVKHIFPQYNVVSILIQKQDEFINLAEFIQSGSRYEITRLDGSLRMFLKTSPEAFFNAFFRPFVWETPNILALLSSLEVLFYSLFLAFSFILMKRKSWSVNNNIILFCGFFVLLMFVLLGWTTPVAGALVRYRVPVLPFLMMIGILVIDVNDIKNKSNALLKKIVPKPILKRYEDNFRKALYQLHKGNKYQCNICKANLSDFIIHYTGDKICARCGSLNRTRRLWQLLEGEFLKQGQTILDFSPSKSLFAKLEERIGITYLSSDFDGSFAAQYSFDITNIDQPKEKFDLIICYHILEHILDDTKAMSELYRVLKYGGVSIIQTPFKEGDIYEDYSILSKKGRLKHFGQEDHVRVYSVESLKLRLEKSGFKVEVRTYNESEDNFNGFKTNETIMICRK